MPCFTVHETCFWHVPWYFPDYHSTTMVKVKKKISWHSLKYHVNTIVLYHSITITVPWYSTFSTKLGLKFWNLIIYPKQKSLQTPSVSHCSALKHWTQCNPNILLYNQTFPHRPCTAYIHSLNAHMHSTCLVCVRESIYVHTGTCICCWALFAGFE